MSFHTISKLAILLSFISLMNCETTPTLEPLKIPPTDLTLAPIIPKPLKINAAQSGFALDEYTIFINDTGDTLYDKLTTYLTNELNNTTGLKLNKDAEPTPGKSRAILFSRNEANLSRHPEAYHLQINDDSLIISTNTAEGAFRSLQTLRQLIPTAGNDSLTSHKVWVIPSGDISDEPYYNFRSTMLDVSRHFFTVEEVKSYIDALSYYKFNMFHMHLSDDQGWRIEIKSWPKLTEIGSKFEVGGGEGGFYTQEEYKQIVDYAAKRFITIIPEIDMPGHTNAASVAYPFLDGTGKPLKPYGGMKVGFSTLDTRKDTVYAFIDDVVREISALTPGPYFHIGGDESHSTKKEDYVYFINRTEKIVKKHGKRMIGWDEVATADIDSTTISQFWFSDANATLASQKGMKIIMSPGKKAYLDMKYDSNSIHGLTWAGMIPVDSAYMWNPDTYIKDFPKNQIIGIEAPLWSETISNLSELQYLAFPRVIGYAELGWSAPENRNWEDYKRRLIMHQGFLETNGINFFRSPRINWSE